VKITRVGVTCGSEDSRAQQVTSTHEHSSQTNSVL